MNMLRAERKVTQQLVLAQKACGSSSPYATDQGYEPSELQIYYLVYKCQGDGTPAKEWLGGHTAVK